jgi:hypothetical protein
MTAGNGIGGVNGTPSLNALLQERMRELGIRNQTTATAMAPQRDPYRMEKYRAEAQWLTDAMSRIDVRPLHVRGLHYAALDTKKPDGTVYENTVENSDWIGDKPAKAARWLGLVPWDDIVDRKNEAAEVIQVEPPNPAPVIRIAGVEVALPDDLAPEAKLEGFRAVQPYRLVLFAEKAAVGHVVRPIAERYGVTTYLMAGEISDTRLYEMARDGAADDRPMVVLTLSDADPAGYWMPSTIAWKLAAHRDSLFPDLEFEVHPIGFLPEQVHAINVNGDPLPSSPLKAGEKRGGPWLEAFGIEQVELDAVATLRPNVLHDIVTQGVKPFYDSSLPRRVREARQEWEAEAQKVLEAQLGPEFMDELRGDLEVKLVELNDLANEINKQLWVPTDGIDLPAVPEIPAPIVNGVPFAFAASGMGYGEFLRAVKRRGEYAKDAAS